METIMLTIKRRQFIRSSVASGFMAFMNSSTAFAESRKAGSTGPAKKTRARFGFSLGLASYTFRAFSLEITVAMTVRLGLEKIVLKDFHLPLDSTPAEITSAASLVRACGLDLYGCGVVYMSKPAEVDRAFSYARAAGMRMIIASPDPVLLPLIEQKTRETDISLAIHNHGPGDRFYPTPAEAYERIRNLDRRLGLCLDIGHAVRSGIDPAEAARKFSDRLLDIHIKDVTASGQEGQTIEIGRGVIDIPSFLRTIIKLNYRGTLAFEFEKDEKDPLPGVAESVGFVRGVLSC
jgi:hypothetical protein